MTARPIWHPLAMPRSSQDEKIRLGEAAEHLVLSRLMRHGYVAAQAPRRYSTFDLFTDKGRRIQVKASRKGRNWLVGQVQPEPTLIYCLVDFEGGDTGTVYVVPSRIVRDATDAYGLRFEELSPGLQETSIRNLMDPWRTRYEPAGQFSNGWLDIYREAWNQLGTPEV
jgi:hypothetical protein